MAERQSRKSPGKADCLTEPASPEVLPYANTSHRHHRKDGTCLRLKEPVCERGPVGVDEVPEVESLKIQVHGPGYFICVFIVIFILLFSCLLACCASNSRILIWGCGYTSSSSASVSTKFSPSTSASCIIRVYCLPPPLSVLSLEISQNNAGTVRRWYR